jgi:WD40 repeat protein
MLAIIRKTAPLIVVFAISLAWLSQTAGQPQAERQAVKPRLAPELVLQTGHLGAIKSIAFSPDGATIATGCADQTVKLWDAKTGELKRTLGGHEAEVHTVFYSRDGRTLVSQSSITPDCSTGDGCVNVIRFWDAQNLNLRRRLEVGGFKSCDVAISPDLKTMVKSDDFGVEVLDVATERAKITLGVSGVAVFAPDGKTVTFQTDTGTIIYDAQTWKPISGRKVAPLDASSGQIERSIESLSNATSTGLSPNGKTIATGDADGNLRLWNKQTQPVKPLWTAPGNKASVRGVILSPDGKTVVIARADQMISLWDLQTGTLTHQQVRYAGEMTGISLSRDGRTLAIKSGEGTATLWDLRNDRHIRTLKPGADKFELSPDLLTMAVLKTNEAQIIDTHTLAS